MTIIFNKRLGTIQSIYSGDLQRIDILYGNEAEDYKLIWDEIIISDDEFVMRNFQNFKINVDTKQLEILAEQINQYPIASQ